MNENCQNLVHTLEIYNEKYYIMVCLSLTQNACFLLFNIWIFGIYVDIIGINPKDFEQRSQKGPTCY